MSEIQFNMAQANVEGAQRRAMKFNRFRSFILLITHHSLLIPIVIVALTLVFFHRLAFSGMILARGDVYAYFYPYWSVRNAALLAGQIPLWSPELFMGVPLLANSQLGTFYPPNWLVAGLTPPQGVTISILMHMAWAMLGVYMLAQRTLRLAAIPALLAAALFGLGGNLGAKVENINQLQALAWMPWLFLVLYRAVASEGVQLNAPSGTRLRGSVIGSRQTVLLGMGLALQLLAGHPQTVFITLVGLFVYGTSLSVTLPRRAANSEKKSRRDDQLDPPPHQLPPPTQREDTKAVLGRWKPENLRLPLSLSLLRPLLILVLAGVLAGLLAVPQLAPTLELAGSSNRSGGLNPQQAMAFSWNPFVIGRGLLPSYDGLLFGEYIAYVGIIGLGLALMGMGTKQNAAWIAVLVVGVALALGLYNPLYWTLAELPGFSFFRVPARWLALFALAAALLAGVGLQRLAEGERPRRRLYGLMLIVIGGLAAASFLTDRMAMDVIGPALPTARTLAGWGIGLVVLLGGMYLLPRLGRRYGAALLCALAILELFLASRVLAYNEVTPPDTYSAQRFTISQMRAYAAEQEPPGRLLSISRLLFDLGDLAALTARYRAEGMSDLAIRIALVATKMRETLAPNLPLAWGVPSIDGFDGGLLPTGYYTQFTALLLPPGELRTIDGRLREVLAREECRGACLPDQRWLNLTNTRYLITDKVYDLWHEDVAYDTQFEVSLGAGESISIRAVPDFTADAINVLCEEDCSPDVIFTYRDGSSERLRPMTNGRIDRYVWTQLRATAARAATAIRIGARDQAVRVRAMTLVDMRTGAFQQLTLGPWKRVLSSDIKVYENLDVQPRAFVVRDVVFLPDTWDGSEMALNLMREPNFNPAARAVIHDDGIAGTVGAGARHALPLRSPTESTITIYTAERVEIQVQTPERAYLILTDAYYPGWHATVNGQPAVIQRADVMFRAVPVPAGESTVVFEYRPGWWPLAPVIGAAAWAAALVMVVITGRRKSPYLTK